ncbi:MAG: hypothetical protein ACP6IP_09035 [Candidatus Njordarchaeia archaeon]
MNLGEEIDLNNMELKDLVLLFFEITYKQLNKKYDISENVQLYSIEGREKYKFNYVVLDHTTGDKIGVWIKDWGRSVGIDVYTRFKRAIKKTGLTMGFLFARKLANGLQRKKKDNIFVFHRGELISMLKKLGINGASRSDNIGDLLKDKFEI